MAAEDDKKPAGGVTPESPAPKEPDAAATPPEKAAATGPAAPTPESPAAGKAAEPSRGAPVPSSPAGGSSAGGAGAATPAAPTSPGAATASTSSPSAPRTPAADDTPARGSTAGTPSVGKPASGSAPATAAAAPTRGTPSTGTRTGGETGRPAGGGSTPPGAGGGGGRGSVPRPATPGGSGGGRPAATPPPSRRGSGGGGWLGGLLGGLLGGVIAWLLISYLLPPAWQTEMQLLQVRVDEIGEALTGEASSSEQLADLASRVELLEVGPDAGLLERVDALQVQVESLQSLGDRLTQLETTGAGQLTPQTEERLAAMEEVGQRQGEVIQRLADQIAASGEEGGDAAQIQERLAALEADIAGLAAGGEGEGAGAEASATMAALREQIDQIQAEIGTLRSDSTGDQLSALDQRLQATEELSGTTSALREQFGELQSALETVAGRVDELTEAVPELGSEVGSALEEMSGQVTSLQDDTQALGGLVSNLQQQVNAVQEQANQIDERLADTQQTMEADTGRRDRAATLALALGQLEGALQRSEGYEQQLAMIQALSEDDQVVAEAAGKLQPMAAEGVPELGELQQRFDQVANEIVRSASADDGGLFSQAASNLSRLVSVRPVGEDVEGDDASARVARAEARLEQGDLAAAVQELEGLEGRAAEAAQPWLEDARTRLAAVEAVDQLQSHARGLLGQQQ